MSGFPWAAWKLWKRNRSTPKRRVKLGIDDGASTSKIVFREEDLDPENPSFLCCTAVVTTPKLNLKRQGRARKS